MLQLQVEAHISVPLLGTTSRLSCQQSVVDSFQKLTISLHTVGVNYLVQDDRAVFPQQNPTRTAFRFFILPGINAA